MSERDDVIEALGGAGILDAIRWAYDSATLRVLDDYSEDAGHDAVWLGVTRFTLFRDRLDRVFSCGRYAVRAGVDATASLDVVRTALSAREVATMPSIPPHAVVRNDLTGSPGWATADLRWLVASVPPGKGVNNFSWTQASPTKQRVAQQPSTDPDLQTLFDHLAPEEQAGIEALTDAHLLDLPTLVVAHSLNALTGVRELVLGHPRLNPRGGEAWQWSHDLLQSPPPDGGRIRPSTPMPSAPDGVPDAPVKLRRPAAAAGETGAGQ
ncbi:hypothetical protein C8K30_101981 [Promicromonospora sp. AC04]|uniref:hypothetical protein n=1 Tax=Promicromonospora sp. AC04 TaxID=2135723 RepID=UPI000D36799E|nr:hypothetical protein [Promicromonospora sp. AC04]PUB32455.1 hypothetical protein C8K30_101981 [Promicromonospora sp. AC04]